MPQKTQILAFWCVPSLLFLTLYSASLGCWFQLDDFAWLQLTSKITGVQSFLRAMFEPYAQGTIRPVSERLFFAGLYTIFGLDPVPFRVVVTLTQIGSLLMLSKVTLQLTRSHAAAFAAPILYIVNANLFWSISWNSAYNQVLCGLTFLSALFLYVRFTETDDRRYQAWHWAVFLFSFGVLELTVVYPAVALLYAITHSRRHVTNVLPMLAVSAVYALGHRWLASPAQVGAYGMHFDASLASTLVRYTRWAAGADEFAAAKGMSTWPFIAAELAVLAALFAFLVRRSARNDKLPVFCAGWFLIALAPYLPLRDHFSEYYLTVPLLGVAMLGGHAVSLASTPRRRLGAAVVLAIYCVPSAWATRLETQYVQSVSARVRTFVERLGYARRLHPGKTLLLRGVDSELFWAGFYHRPHRLFGREEVYLTAETEALVDRPRGAGSISHYFAGESSAYRGIRNGDVVVYDVRDERMWNITPVYLGILAAKQHRDLPRFIDVGVPIYSEHLRTGWHRQENGYRWMSKQAVVELGGPAGAGALLRVSGSCPPQQLSSGPLLLTVSVDGRKYPPSTIESSTHAFTFTYTLGPEVRDKTALQVALEVNRTISTATDGRDLGLVFGRFEIVRQISR